MVDIVSEYILLLYKCQYIANHIYSGYCTSILLNTKDLTIQRIK